MNKIGASEARQVLSYPISLRNIIFGETVHSAPYRCQPDWSRKRYLKFFQDIHRSFKSNEHFFAGLIVLRPVGEGSYELADGYHRLLASITLFAAVSHYLDQPMSDAAGDLYWLDCSGTGQSPTIGFSPLGIGGARFMEICQTNSMHDRTTKDEEEDEEGLFELFDLCVEFTENNFDSVNEAQEFMEYIIGPANFAVVELNDLGMAKQASKTENTWKERLSI